MLTIVLSIKRGTLYKTEVRHDLAILLPILCSVSRVNAYLNSQHHMNVPTINSVPMPWSSDRENSVALSQLT